MEEVQIINILLDLCEQHLKEKLVGLIYKNELEPVSVYNYYYVNCIFLMHKNTTTVLYVIICNI